jgi:Methylase involved in ubiquinone/menaquinone biosynthesis
VKAVKAFAEELPFEDSTFGLVFMANSFHDFDRERARAEVDRVLKPTVTWRFTTGRRTT